MEIKYRSLLKEWSLTLESDVLDPAFTQKATEFETKLKNNELTDDEIKAWDDDLIKCFNDLHSFSEEDSAEVKAANRKAEISEAKNVISEVETLEALTALQTKYAHLSELAPFIEKRIEKVQNVQAATQRDKYLSETLEEIKAADYDTLPALLKKYTDHPDIIKAIESRIEKDKPAPKAESLRDKLSAAKKREWSYGELKAIGINPTDQDMEIEGVYLERAYMFRVYRITKVDGKKI